MFQGELESLPPLSIWPSEAKRSTYESWNPYAIPEIPEDFSIKSWRYITGGAHGQIWRAVVCEGNKISTVCFKLFTEDYHSEQAYYREWCAYALLIHRKVKHCIPKVYYCAVWPRWKWEGEQQSARVKNDPKYGEEWLYGLVMEWFEDSQEIDLRKGNLRLAEVLGQGLERIHEAMVAHRDIEPRNILLTRQSGKLRVVWLDFSSAWCGTQYKFVISQEWLLFRSLLYKYMVNELSHLS